MSANTIAMSTIKQIIRLYTQGRPIKEITRVSDSSRNTVRKYIALFKRLPFPLEELLNMEDQALEQLILPSSSEPKPDRYSLLQSQLENFINELDQIGVNRFLLWTEYRQKYPGGYSYSQFCYYLQQYCRIQQTSMIIDHTPGDLLFVDFAGHPMEYIDLSTGEVIKVQVFIACLGYSQYSYVEAIPSQKAEDFITVLNNCLSYLQGAPQGIVPDNLKSAVIKACPYEPKLNIILEDWANHNRTTILPARSRHPKDKALAENLVKQTYSRIYAPLRHRRFTSLFELNTAIRERLNIHNQEKFRKKDYSRKDLFISKEKHLLALLPEETFRIKKYRTLTLQKNAHLYLTEDRHYYSAPYAYIGQKVEVVYTTVSVCIYIKGVQVAQHLRDKRPHTYTTVAAHLPSQYNQYKDRSPEYYLERAHKISDVARTVIERLLSTKKHPEQLYKSCDGVLSLAGKCQKDEFNNACELALQTGACNYSFMRTILSNGTARAYNPKATILTPPTPLHHNIRGKEYYNKN